MLSQDQKIANNEGPSKTIHPWNDTISLGGVFRVACLPLSCMYIPCLYLFVKLVEMQDTSCFGFLVCTGEIGSDRLQLNEIDLKGQRVLIHVDFNVPFDVGDPTVVIPSARLQMDLAIPTMLYCIENGAKSVVLASRLCPPVIGGHPWSTSRARLSLGPLATVLSRMIDRKVVFFPQCIGRSVVAYCSNPPPGTVILLEELPDDIEERGKTTRTRTVFINMFAKLADIFINDTFATIHTHNSDVMLGAGFRIKTFGKQIAKELDNFNQV